MLISVCRVLQQMWSSIVGESNAKVGDVIAVVVTDMHGAAVRKNENE